MEVENRNADFSFGQLNGPLTKFYTNGQKMYTCNFTNSFPKGAQNLWYDDGQMNIDCKYKNSKLKSSKIWIEKGTSGHYKRKFGKKKEYIFPRLNKIFKSNEIVFNFDARTSLNEHFIFLDQEAGFPGGIMAMMSWINTNVDYPQTSIVMNEQGRVFLSFVVEKDGSITDVTIERGVSPDIDREAKRVVLKMPKWNPGIADGVKVRARCRLPINFRLN